MIEREDGRVNIYLRQRPGPYQIVMLAVAALGGLEIIIRGRGVGGTLTNSPIWTTQLLGGALVLTSGVGVVGILVTIRGKRVIGPLIEQSGILAQVLLLLTYTAIVWIQSGERALVTATFFTGFVVSGIWRAIQIQYQIKETRTMLRRARGKQ